MADDGPDLAQPRRVHVTNVGGAGMSAVATVLLEMGHRVSGHDPNEASPFLAPLVALGVQVSTGPPAPDGLPDGTELVVTSTATPTDHPHVVAARQRQVPTWHRSQALAAICGLREALAVAGTHGKTTTSALLATVLEGAGRRPGWIVGAGVPGLGRSATWGGDGPLVVEADESDGTFLALGAVAGIVTNVEADHLEHWGGEAGLREGFVRFVDALPGPAVLCLDDPGAAELVAHARQPVTYGTDPAADYVIDQVVTDGTGVGFGLAHGDEHHRVVVAGSPGLHTARNAAAALALAHRLGVPLEEGVAALAGFEGVDRRFEVRGEAGGVTFVDSYDHLPTEVAAALGAAAAGPWRRVVCCFQPHRYSRTEALWRSFADAFDGADVLAVTDVYPAGEAPRPAVTGKLVVDAVLDAHPWRRVAWVPTLDDAVTYLRATLRPGDLCLTLGAGDLTTIPDRLVEALSERGVSDRRAIAAAADGLGDLAEADVPLGPLTTYRVGGPAALLVRVEEPEQLGAVAAVVAATGIEVLVVGKGSNLLVADAGFPGLAVVLGEGFASIDVEGTTVRAGGAAALPVVARRTVAAGLSGFEWAVGVPGSIGGGVRMNAGGHGADLAASLVGVHIVDLRTGEDGPVPAAALDLGYRRSAVLPHQVVVEAELALAPGDPEQGAALLAEIVAWRRANQPGGPNAGSVFANPEGDAAARLIDDVGAKGRRHGTAAVSTKHANFIQADDGGRADDVYALMGEMHDLVLEATGIALRPETRCVGFPSNPRLEDPRREVEG